MTMKAGDHAVGQAARGFHLPDVFPEIDRIGLGPDGELVAETKCLAEEIVAVRHALLARVALVSAPLDLRFPSDAPSDLAQLGERRRIDLVDLLVTETVDPRMAQRVIALIARPGAAPELPGGRDQRNAS